MDSGPVVCEQFLGPSAELVAWPAVIGDFLDRVAIADPVEMGAPDVGLYARESPATSGNLADEGMAVGFR